ncbi:ATP synthase subunit I [Thermodesulfobacteriota bacterium]
MLLGGAAVVSLLLTSFPFALGVVSGGLLVSVNFYLLRRTLKNSLDPHNLVSHNAILGQYYIRFTISGIIIFLLISQHVVNPLGLFVGLSVIVASVLLATVYVCARIGSKEAT